jgi:photosystem II stability/assembly factor-like uncharacterized protein
MKLSRVIITVAVLATFTAMTSADGAKNFSENSRPTKGSGGLPSAVPRRPTPHSPRTIRPAYAPYPDKLFGDLSWRLIGPFRAGRALAVTGVPGKLETYYFGAVGGGVWLTENAGRTWTPVFDHESAASIGAIAVAPSDPNVVYVGAGEADMRSDIQQGDGMYRSSDAGKTWSHIGLTDTRQIGKIIVDPQDSNVLYVAALGHQFGPNTERGVFKSIDGGKTWTKILYKDENTGAIDLSMDPVDTGTIYAATWQTRRPPWSIYPPSNGPGSGLYKTIDAGATWTQIKGDGFPSNVARVGIAVSPADHMRVYAFVDSADRQAGGIYRSDDGGVTWTHTDGDARVWGRGWYFAGITADPKDRDKVYVMNTSTYMSTDGGKTFTAIKGAPGGDDYHTLWINPDDPTHMILGCDQGVIVSVDDANTWSSWYNQPTGQFYHVIADNRFPYWVYGSQQDSGAMAVPSRTIHTGISDLDWRPIDAGGESGTIAPDPLHPGLLLSSTGGKEVFDTGWEQSIDPTASRPGTVYRSEWTAPIATSPANPHVTYTSHQQIFRTGDGGSTWTVISPDLTQKKSAVPPNLDKYAAADDDGQPRKGVVYWIAPSPIKAKQIWAGTDDGLIWLTRDDGVHWKDVTPPALGVWSKVGVIDASHFDTETAYAAIDRHCLDDNRPYVYRTHDGGRHWKLVVNGLPAGHFLNVVREDPKKPGLLYAGSDWGMFVSFDDGDHWQSLQLNLPPASVRDIVFDGNDVIVGTHGRAIWILDDVSRLRQFNPVIAESPIKLFKPAEALVFQRAGTFGFGQFNEGTPLPPEEPQGQNPAWGAVIDYALGEPAKTAEFTITDSKGKFIRRLSSHDKLPVVDPNALDIPAYWIKPQQPISTDAGAHRLVWNFQYKEDNGPIVPPGHYTVTMIANGHKASEPLTVLKDPRLRATQADLETQFQFVLAIEDEIAAVQSLRTKAADLLKRYGSSMSASDAQRLGQLVGARPRGRRRRMPPGLTLTSFGALESALGGLQAITQSALAAPTTEYKQTFTDLKLKASQAQQTLKEISKKTNR